jgi:hypothetical protein
VVEYYRAAGATDLIQGAIDTVQDNLRKEQSQFQLRPENPAYPADNNVFDQKSTLMLYAGDCPYTDFNSAQDVISQMNSSWVGNRNDWRLPTLDELLGNDEIWGLFSEYNSNAGSPVQWLMVNGFPKDMTGIHFWTSTQVPPPDPNDSQYQYGQDGQDNPIPPERDYNADLQAWQAGGPPTYCVDSSNLSQFGVNHSDQAHVVAVTLIQLPQPLLVVDSDGNYPFITNRKSGD